MDISFKGVFKVFNRNFEVYKRYFWNRFINSTLYPLFFLFSIGFGLGHFIGKINGITYPSFIAPALIASACMFGASFVTTYGTYVKMRYQKTFSAMVSTPLSFHDVVFGEILTGAIRSVIDAFFIFIVTCAFGLCTSFKSLLIFPVLFLTGFIFSIIGTTIASIVSIIDQFDYYFTLYISLMFLFSGTFFPIDRLPPLFQKLSLFLPLTHTINLVRPLYLGKLPSDWLFSLIAHFIFILILIPFPFILLKKRIIEYA